MYVVIYVNVSSHTHTGRLLYGLQQTSGRNQEVSQTLEGIAVVTAIDDLEELVEDSGGRDLER